MKSFFQIKSWNRHLSSDIIYFRSCSYGLRHSILFLKILLGIILRIYVYFGDFYMQDQGDRETHNTGEKCIYMDGYIKYNNMFCIWCVSYLPFWFMFTQYLYLYHTLCSKPTTTNISSKIYRRMFLVALWISESIIIMLNILSERNGIHKIYNIFSFFFSSSFFISCVKRKNVSAVHPVNTKLVCLCVVYIIMGRIFPPRNINFKKTFMQSSWWYLG